MTESPGSNGSTPRSSTDRRPSNGQEEKPHGIAKITQAFKRLSGSNGATANGDAPSGKAHARHEHHRIVKEEKEERIRSERSSLDQKRQEEDEQARKSESEAVRALYGELVHPGEIVSLRAIEELQEGMEVTFRARIHTQRRVSAALDFLLFRDQTDTIQGVLHREDGSAHMVKWTQRLPPESIVQVTGTLTTPKSPVKSATVHNLEVTIHSIHLVRDAHDLPFDLYHEDEEPVHKRLESRIVDLRHPCNQAVFRVRSKIMQAFREALYQENFLELSTPKLQPAATESGAEVFKVNYFGRTAFLAQSPQLAKQMAISADFGRVMEIGPVFRAENSNTHRHLTEYTGLDIEMAIKKDYREIIDVLCKTLKHIFASVQAMRPELERIRERWPSEDLVWLEDTPIIPFAEGIKMLQDDGRDVDLEDLSTRDEIRLGELVKEKYHTDFFVLDKFVLSARPFYCMPDENDPTFSNSFDMFIRGQEVCTGGQRINDPKKLRKRMKEAGIDEASMQEYLEAFDWGVPPHGGAGLGLERIVFLMLNLGNVRFASLFHRDPKSLPTKPPSLPHPEASTLRHHSKEDMRPVEELIANYGDATNTSWLDERFEVWRHEGTGAAVGYVKQKKFAMIAGNPLCDNSQLSTVIRSFLDFVRDDLKLTPIWMLISNEVQEYLARQLRWRTLTCVEEQRVDTDTIHAKDYSSDQRKLEREGVEISEEKPTEELQAKVNKRIEDWKAARSTKGKQIHLTEIRPFVDTEHRRYFIAEKKDEVQAMVVLAKLSPEHGWQVKWALDFPNSVGGSIEVLVSTALSSVSGKVTFGAGVSEKLVPGHHLHGMRAKFLARSYNAITNSLHLNRKAEFRQKFGTVVGDPVYIAYPKNGVAVSDLNAIVAFFED